MKSEPGEQFSLPATPADRAFMGILGIVVGAFGAWMGWVVQKFLDGNTWGDFIVRVILNDLVFAILLFAVALIVHAVFPKLGSWLLEKTTGTMTSSVAIVFICFGVPMLLFLALTPVLWFFGIVN